MFGHAVLYYPQPLYVWSYACLTMSHRMLWVLSRLSSFHSLRFAVLCGLALCCSCSWICCAHYFCGHDVFSYAGWLLVMLVMNGHNGRQDKTLPWIFAHAWVPAAILDYCCVESVYVLALHISPCFTRASVKFRLSHSVLLCTTWCLLSQPANASIVT
jgi:hypothetical protein